METCQTLDRDGNRVTLQAEAIEMRWVPTERILNIWDYSEGEERIIGTFLEPIAAAMNDAITE